MKPSKKQHYFAYKTAILLILPAMAVAQSAPSSPTHQPNNASIACTSLKAAQAYAQAMVSSPVFAKDLRDRATCFSITSETEIMSLGKPQQGFQQLQLLSGHRVWVPAQQQH